MNSAALSVIVVVTALLFLKVYSKKPGSMETQLPPTVEELGRCAWTWLHSVAAHYSEHAELDEQKGMAHLIYNFARFYPCTECATNLKQELKEFPPKVGGRREMEQWLCALHNKVNARLNKPAFDCSMATYRWRGLSGCNGKCQVK